MCFRPIIVAKKKNICPECKKVNAPEATVCAFCGAKLELPPPPGRPGGAPPRPPAGPPPKPPTPPAGR